jgi:hypothetical protein
MGPKRTLIALTTAVCAAGAALAQEAGNRTVVAGPQYKAGGFHRLLWGANYRDLWATPVDLPVLDFKTYAGGLTATRRLGHGQTKALALRGKNGVDYTFRPIVKDPVGLLPEELHETFAAKFIRDQMSSQHPAAHVIVPGLIEPLGLLHNTPELVVMPDDPALGEFRDDFKDLVGDIEEYVGQKGFAGAEELAGEEMWTRLDKEPGTRIDSREFLKARLLDHLIGDWDRHLNQWRWAKLPGRDKWRTIPEDRDQAFVRFQGLGIGIVRPTLPLLVVFGDDYPGMPGLAFDSWAVDRRILSDLPHAAYAEVAREITGALTDEVIEAAVRRMPKAWFDKLGSRMIADLKARRDDLPAQAERFFDYFANEVDVRASEQDDVVDVERHPDGGVTVRIALASAPAAPYFARRFVRGETEDVRVHLLAGNDKVVTRGPRGKIRLRVIGGAGEDLVDDSAVGGVRVSDAEGRTTVKRGLGTRLDDDPYQPTPNPRGWWIPPRDWGRHTLFPVIRLSGSTDHGAVLTAGMVTTGYGFRKEPWADHQALRFSYATRPNAFRGEYDGRFRFENSKLELRLRARASGFEQLRFYGFGNETESTLPDDFYRVHQNHFTVDLSLSFPLSARATGFVGGRWKRVTTEERPGAPLTLLRPYGIGDTRQVGVVAGLDLDTTDRSGLPHRGIRVSVAGSALPEIEGLERPFGALQAEATGYLTKWATLALRAGGKSVFGTYPFYEAAFLGGSPSLRGLRLQRYAGDSMLHGGADLYLPLTKAFLLVPGEIGVFGLADAGRVYLDGEESDRWHSGFGGGLYFVSPNRNNRVELSYARSEGKNGFYLRLGLALP